MSRAKKPRSKKYVPREVQLDAVGWALAGAHLLPAGAVTDCMAVVDAAFLAMKQGRATRDDWNGISQCLNIAEALAGLQIGSNLMPQIERGQEALDKIARRMLEFGDKHCKAPELAAITESLAMYRIQLKLCTQAEMSRAVQKVKNLIQGGAMRAVEHVYNGIAA